MCIRDRVSTKLDAVGSPSDCATFEMFVVSTSCTVKKKKNDKIFVLDKFTPFLFIKSRPDEVYIFHILDS